MTSRSETDLIAFARETLRLGGDESVRLDALGRRGSDRTYYRLRREGDTSAILVQYDPRRAENASFAAIAAFLLDIGIPVPRVLAHDARRCLLVVEDLGDRDLWSFRESPWEVRRSLYMETLAVLARLHSFPPAGVPPEVKLMDAFGPDLYRWERDYFVDHFVRGLCGVTPDQDLGCELEETLSGLAARLAEGKQSLVHRDCQSQNIMIRSGQPVLIDFQGLRLGSPFYDVASLLCDPYVSLTDEERTTLLTYSWDLCSYVPDRATFDRCFWEASVQRLMQALGAYGFLARHKGLTAFLDHVPSGLDRLEKAAAEARLPFLPDLLRECRKGLGLAG